MTDKSAKPAWQVPSLLGTHSAQHPGLRQPRTGLHLAFTFLVLEGGSQWLS